MNYIKEYNNFTNYKGIKVGNVPFSYIEDEVLFDRENNLILNLKDNILKKGNKIICTDCEIDYKNNIINNYEFNFKDSELISYLH